MISFFIISIRIQGWVHVLHIPIYQKSTKKNDDKSDKCIFIDYGDVTKCYKLYDSETGKLIVSRDVQFLENESWTWTT